MVCLRASLLIISATKIVRKLSRFWWQGLLVIAAVVAASVLTLISLCDFQRKAVPPENRPIQSQIAGYVSSNACRACHPGNYASWHASFHRTMTQVATPQFLPPDMDKLELAYNGREYKAERRGDKLFVRTRPEGASYGEPQQVVLVTGSHTLQILWLETGQGRTLEQFPFAYIIAEKMWAPVTQTFLMPPETKEDYSIGAWNGACMDCHVTQGQSRIRRGQQVGHEVAEFGIACEACHSEGREHIAAQSQSVSPFETSSHNEVRPDDRQSGENEGSGIGAGLRPMSQRLGLQWHGGEDRFQSARRKISSRRKTISSQRFVVQPNEQDHLSRRISFARPSRIFFATVSGATG